MQAPSVLSLAMVSLLILLASSALASVLSLDTGRIYSPAHRNTVGPALASSCGQSVADYLKVHPNPTLGEINVLTSCDVNICSTYQKADNVDKIQIYKASTVINVTVGYTIPPPPSDEYYSSYFSELDVINATTLLPVVGATTYNAPSDTTTPHNITLSSWKRIEEVYAQFGSPIPPNACATAGECFLRWRVVDYFRQPHLISGRYYYSSCIDLVIDHSG